MHIEILSFPITALLGLAIAVGAVYVLVYVGTRAALRAIRHERERHGA